MVNKLFEFLRPWTEPVLCENHHQGQVVDHVPKERAEKLDLQVVHVQPTVFIAKESITEWSEIIIIDSVSSFM